MLSSEENVAERDIVVPINRQIGSHAADCNAHSCEDVGIGQETFRKESGCSERISFNHSINEQIKAFIK